MRQYSHVISARGFSLVELMVAMVIGLIGMIIIFQVFEVSEGIRRTTTSGGDAQQSGTLALYQMERDLRNGGMGFSDTTLAGCFMVGSDSTQTPNQFFTAAAKIPITPVYIVNGATAATPDTVSVFYGAQGQVTDSVTLTLAMGSPTDDLSVSNPFGYRAGDLVLLAQPFAPAGQTCNFMEITAIPAGSNQLKHDTATYTNFLGNAVASRFNPAGGLGVSYPAGSTALATRVFNLGNLYDANALPVYNTYTVTNNTLTVKSAFSSVAAVAVADNIIDMRALYGLDDGVDNGTVPYSTTFAAADGVVDRYVDVPTFNAIAPLPWASIMAVRVAVVARSATPETSSQGVGNACDATITAPAPSWPGGAFPAVQSDPNWQCYRYRVYETTVPIRNWIWRSS